MFEPLEARVLLSGDVLTAALQGIGPAPLEVSGLADVHKLMVAGDPQGSPADSPGLRVDPNTTDSLYAGVGSLRVDATAFDGYTYIGSATAISPTHVLTAAHMLDLDNNGTIDVAPTDVDFILNFGSDFSHVITASALFIHPDWTGFLNPSVSDDVAVIELSIPLPAGVPIYALNTDPFDLIETVTLVGYGTSGDGVGGYYIDPEFEVKRVGGNLTDFFDVDDEGSGAKEIFEYDFDRPDGSTGFSSTPGLGNDVETTLGGGDSGGPAFIDDGSGGLEIFGINTYSFGYLASAPLFGSGGGGIVVAEYADWIDSVVSGEALGQGFTLSKSPDFSSDDQEFSTADTLYIKIWSDSVDFNNIKKANTRSRMPTGAGPPANSSTTLTGPTLRRFLSPASPSEQPRSTSRSRTPAEPRSR